MKDQEILTRTLQSMPKIFTSNQFCITARKEGITEHFIRWGGITKFLTENAENITPKRWKKKINEIKQNKIEFVIEPVEEDYEEFRCINYLKNKGYRIQKLVEI